MSSHGNPAQAAKINTRGEPTNAAMAAHRAAGAPAAPVDVHAARRAELQARAADYFKRSNTAQDAANIAQQRYDAAQLAWTRQEFALQAARDHYRAESDRMEQRLEAAGVPRIQGPLTFSPEQVAIITQREEAIKADTAYMQAQRALDDAENRAKALQVEANAAHTVWRTQQERADEYHYQAERALAHADRLDAPDAHRFDHITPERLAEVQRAQTTNDVRSWLERQFPGIVVRLKGATPAAARAAAAELGALAHQFPYAAARLEYLVYLGDPDAGPQAGEQHLAGDISRMTHGEELSPIGGQAKSNSGGRPGHFGVVLTNAVLNDQHPGYQQLWELDASHRWSARPADVSPAAYVMRHEFGHLVGWTIGERAHAAHDPHLAGARAAQARVERIGKTSGAQDISQYAATDEAERFAEAFAAGAYGDARARQDPYTQAVMQAAEAFA